MTNLSRPRKWFSRAVLLGGGILLGTSATLAGAAGTGVIDACVRTSSGDIQIVTGGTACKSGWSPLTWNQTGPQGPVGPAGPAGPAGAVGAPGATGATGVTGAPGTDGQQGLKGDKGDQGIQGATGATGDQGIQGDKGDKGDQGVPGPAGVVSPITRIITANLMGINSESGFAAMGHGVRMLKSDVSTNGIYTFAVGYDYAGGELRVREMYRVHDNFGTVVLDCSVLQQTPTPTGEVSGFGCGLHGFTFSSSYRSFIWTIHESFVTPGGGDLFRVNLNRSNNPNDTAGRLDLIGVAVEYQAIQ